MNKPAEPGLPVQPKTENRERESASRGPAEGRQEFFLDMPRAGARERLAAAELKRGAGR